MRNAVLVENGVPRGAIHLDAAADDFHRFVAEEIQRYIELLTGGRLPVVTEPDSAPSGGLILVCGPQANDAVGGLAERGAVDLGGLTADGAYVLKSVDIDGRGGMVVAGADDAGTMYAAYELLERLGVVFQLTGDIIPERKPDLVLPELDVVEEPARKFRGVHVWHAYSWYMGLADYRRLIDQLAKMKMNVLQFFWGMGAPWVEVFHEGVRGELTTTPESGYLAIGKDTRSWGRSVHTTTGNRSDVRVGRECFPHERLCAPEFRDVNSEDEAYAVAVPFLREIIRYAHRRRVQLWLVSGELPFVAPNLAPRSAKVDHGVAASESYSYQRYCGVAVAPGDPAALDIWELTMRAVIETYPEADSYGFWAPEHSPDFDDPRTRALLGESAAILEHIPPLEEIHATGNLIPRTPRDLECDALQMYLAAELIRRLKRHHPEAQIGVGVLFRGYLMRALDAVLPADAWIANMENCGNAGPLMERYEGMPGRDLVVVPRIVDDGCELHMQMNATMFDRDQIVTGAERFGATGIIGQLGKERGQECTTRFLADGCWAPDLDCESFYTAYLARLYGRDAADQLVEAYLLLEEHERALVWWGRSEIFVSFHGFSPCRLRTDVDYAREPLEVGREELERDIAASWDQSGTFWFWRRNAVGAQHEEDRALRPDLLWQRRAAQYRTVVDLLRCARPRVLTGSRNELDYVIFKTENFAAYFDVLQECEEARIELDRAYLARLDRDEADAGDRLERCRAALQRADRHAQGAAGQMLAYSDEKAERHLLFRFNQNVIASIESGRDFVDGVIATHRSQIR
jgi:hypothetical protein